MFDFAWSEIGLIAVVALVFIGPKDLPVAIKTVAAMIKKARRMAGEFQTHVDEMVREANLGEVRDQISQIRNFDVRGEIERAVDSDGSIRAGFSDPMATPPAPGQAAPPVTEIAAHGTATAVNPLDIPFIQAEQAGLSVRSPPPAPVAAPDHNPAPPAFIPPAAAVPAAPFPHPAPPAFIPPAAAQPAAAPSDPA